MYCSNALQIAIHHGPQNVTDSIIKGLDPNLVSLVSGKINFPSDFDMSERIGDSFSFVTTDASGWLCKLLAQRRIEFDVSPFNFWAVNLRVGTQGVEKKNASLMRKLAPPAFLRVK